MRSSLLVLVFLSFPASADETDDARKRWSESPYGPMLERIIPPGFTSAMLPEPASRGAELTRRYCVQCHNLANPAMHEAARWPSVIARMVPRMQGKGNLGKVMGEMMAGVQSPSDEEARTLVAYHRKHAQQRLDEAKYPEVNLPSGESFRLACKQCHVLPDPQRHTAAEWRAVVARMQTNMEWMNRVVGTKPVPGEPQLRIEDINAFLAKYAKKAR
jgi:cytochrome c2